MSKLKPEDAEKLGYTGEFDDDDIEILEVVGLDEDSPAAAAYPDEDEVADAPPDEVVVDFGGAAGASLLEPPPTPGSGEDDSDRERLLRLHADFENFRRRVEREREATERHSTAALISRLLPVLDNFERAIAACSGDDPGGFHDGVAMIFRQLLDELRRDGLQAIDSVGQPFDPELHDAVATEISKDLPHHTVVEEMQRGYLLHDRLLRPALVRVSVDPDATEDDEDH